jgi:C4-dicarboxylate-specific signal transduction histidine kinase
LCLSFLSSKRTLLVFETKMVVILLLLLISQTHSCLRYCFYAKSSKDNLESKVKRRQEKSFQSFKHIQAKIHGQSQGKQSSEHPRSWKRLFLFAEAQKLFLAPAQSLQLKP